MSDQLQANPYEAFDVLCPRTLIEPEETAQWLFQAVRTWARDLGADASEVELLNEQDAIRRGTSYGEPFLFQISWPAGPRNWPIRLSDGRSFDAVQERAKTAKTPWYWQPVNESILGIIRRP